jgi:hypothetical protein
MLQLDKNERISIEELYSRLSNVNEGIVLQNRNINGGNTLRNANSLKINVNKKEVIDGKANCRLRLL